MSRRFVIGSLLAAGFGPHDALQASITGVASGARPDEGKLFQIFRQDHLYTLAGHASHSSHSSHASHGSGSGGHSSHYSHTSHYSSTGGYSAPSYNPAPVYTPVPTPAPAPAPPAPSQGSNDVLQSIFGDQQTQAAANLKPLPGRSALFKKVVMRLQVALMGRGLFDGPIDGNVGPKTRAALRQFQQSQGLQVTGTITPATLDALHVSSQ
jgi:His-Xaa-Ser repeat protein HxsA